GTGLAQVVEAGLRTCHGHHLIDQVLRVPVDKAAAKGKEVLVPDIKIIGCPDIKIITLLRFQIRAWTYKEAVPEHFDSGGHSVRIFVGSFQLQLWKQKKGAGQAIPPAGLGSLKRIGSLGLQSEVVLLAAFGGDAVHLSEQSGTPGFRGIEFIGQSPNLFRKGFWELVLYLVRILCIKHLPCKMLIGIVQGYGMFFIDLIASVESAAEVIIINAGKGPSHFPIL